MLVPIQVNLREAKAKFFQLAEKAGAGEKVTITRNGRPYLELRPYTAPQRRKPGRLAGKIDISEDFDETPGEFIAHERAP
ncbi:type II toxin-antitoxin system prevent-host-death family antitoxin [Ectothiorhodospiraceae bacterium WFHF3C12]|nr:type II toxin-antitoxin system prevent-host-death family antitoxin [Ectothiorhodospiraceae bacterium WFHF3C12]